MSFPKFILGIQELNQEIQNNLDKSILLVFTASWCGPCQKLKQHLNSTDETSSIRRLSDKLMILYIDVDEDENAELTEIYNVTGMPTQVLIKLNHDIENNRVNIEKKTEIVGCDIIKLTTELDKHC